ncbi:MAG TPA: DUF2306 domain-containing protein [Burkholderiaceae bacterium]|nr:DUF2306 domain-containing protein [Burkholderiaceae bacterium]
MSTIGKTHPFVVVGLLMLTTVPLASGAFRVVELMGNAEITAENARFIAAPIPVMTHIVSSLLFCVFGAFQFSPRLRRSRPGWHLAGGRIAVPMGFAAALSGVWMTQFYPWAGYDGPALYVIRLVVGTAMVLSLVLAIVAIRRRDIPSHVSWMTRAYALGIGAGTQVFTHIPWFVFPGMQGELARTVCMAAGWAINIGVAEWAILRMTQLPTKDQFGGQDFAAMGAITQEEPGTTRDGVESAKPLSIK